MESLNCMSARALMLSGSWLCPGAPQAAAVQGMSTYKLVQCMMPSLMVPHRASWMALYPVVTELPYHNMTILIIIFYVVFVSHKVCLCSNNTACAKRMSLPSVEKWYDLGEASRPSAPIFPCGCMEFGSSKIAPLHFYPSLSITPG